MLEPWLRLATLSAHLAAAPQGGFAGDPGPSPRCPDDMRLVEGTHHDDVGHVCTDVRKAGKVEHCYRYAEGITLLEGPVTEVSVCVDQFEAPNVRGARPMVLQSYESASAWCEKRGKRLCTEQEWELACEGPQRLPWAYGWAVDRRLCNSNKAWKPVSFEKFDGPRDEARKESDRLWQGSGSGRYKTCVSPFGVVDMMGNVEEWVTSRPGRRWPGALMGGFWAKPWTGCRGTNDAHQPTFAFYETGFRCCKEPGGVGDVK